MPDNDERNHIIKNNIVGMSILFAVNVSSEENNFLFAEIARQEIDSLSIEQRDFVDNEVDKHLQNHGFKNVKRPITIQTNDAFVTLKKTFEARPKPIVSDTPLIVENVKIHDIIYPKSQAVLLPIGVKKLTVNMNPHDLVLFDKLHVAGKNNDLLRCEMREVVGVQNKLEYELLSVELQPQLQAV
jgi:hypothetical protein